MIKKQNDIDRGILLKYNSVPHGIEVSMQKYTEAVIGEFKKFNPDGTTCSFPGNTFLCHIPSKSSFYRFAVWAQAEMGLASCWHKFGFLPSSSFHMTVFEGACDHVRKASNWTSALPLDTPLDDVTRHFLSKIPESYKPNGFMMRAKAVAVNGGMQFLLEPANKKTAEDLVKFRSVIKEATGMVNHNEEGYHFHCSLSYVLQEMSSKDKEETGAIIDKINNRLQKPYNEIQLGPVEFCLFKNMEHFTPVVKLV